MTKSTWKTWLACCFHADRKTYKGNQRMIDCVIQFEEERERSLREKSTHKQTTGLTLGTTSSIDCQAETYIIHHHSLFLQSGRAGVKGSENLQVGCPEWIECSFYVELPALQQVAFSDHLCCSQLVTRCGKMWQGRSWDPTNLI